MAEKSSKRQLEQYEHSYKERANNPYVVLVTPSSDPDPDTGEKKKYKYDPLLDPQLQWVGKRNTQFRCTYSEPACKRAHRTRNHYRNRFQNSLYQLQLGKKTWLERE